MPNKIVVYFFSGTGNAKNVAYWFCKKAEENGHQCKIIDVSKIDRHKMESPPADSLIGFISPTHGFNLPPIMLDFLARFPKSKNNKTFVINTRAGMKLNRLFLPGLSGIALYYAMLVLLFKNYKIVGARSIDLPSNWISLHPGLRKNITDSIHQRCKTITEKFAQKMTDGKKEYRAFYDIIQNILISPISIGYYLVGRFFLSKSFIADRNCNNCNLCIKSCPVKAIKNVWSKPFWTYRCESCMKCMNNCPESSIQTCHGFLALIIYVTNIYVLGFIYKMELIENSIIFEHNSFRILIFSILFIPILFIGYRLAHYLMRFSIFERIIKPLLH